MVNSRTKPAQKTRTTKAKSVKNSATSNATVKPNADVATASIQMIPLNKLELSPKNVRKVQPSEADDIEGDYPLYIRN